MKKLMIISSFVFGCALSSSAQITESSYIVGGSSSFAYSGSGGGSPSRVSFSINPEIGKFVSEKWLIGGNVGYGFSQLKNGPSNSHVKTSSHGFIGGFAATRFYPMADKLYFTLRYSADFSYGTTIFKTINGSQSSSVSGESISPHIGVSPGLAYFINPKWMIYAQMGALSYSYDYSLTSKSGVHNLGYNFQANSFGIGARYVLGTKK